MVRISEEKVRTERMLQMCLRHPNAASPCIKEKAEKYFERLLKLEQAGILYGPDKVIWGGYPDGDIVVSPCQVGYLA